MLQPDNTYRQQQQLAEYCRTGKHKPVTDKPENTTHYRRLVYNVVDDILASAFPLTKNLLSETYWNRLVENFMENHPCKTAQVWKLSAEFYEFYIHNPIPFKNNHPFIKDLLLFEYKEIEVFMMEDIEADTFQTEGNIEMDILVPNPEIQILSLEYPVHTKKAKEITTADKSNYFVSLHRNNVTKEVAFNELSYPFVEILAMLHETEMTFKQAVKVYSKYESNKAESKKMTKSFLQFAITNNLILGFKKNNHN